MQAVGDRSKLPLGFGIDVRALMEGTKELVSFVGMGTEEALLALPQLLLEGLNGSGQALLLCNQAGNVIICVIVLLELRCNSTVLLGL